MLFRLHPQTPKFRVFELLNEELIYFLNKSINQQRFGRRLFSYTPVGKACWNNFLLLVIGHFLFPNCCNFNNLRKNDLGS